MDRFDFFKSLSFLEEIPASESPPEAQLPSALVASGYCCFVFVSNSPQKERYIYFSSQNAGDDPTQLVRDQPGPIC
jgi:hypothetical protein